MANTAEYWLKFPDGSPASWDVQRNGDSWSVTFPNGGTVTIDITNPRLDFNADFAEDRESSRLWSNSLRYIVKILSAGDVTTPWALVEQLSNFLDEDPCDENGQFSGSLDHQYALMLRTLCELQAWLATNEGKIDDVPERALLLRECVKKIYGHVDSLELLRPNNHGVMLGISILHSLYMFKVTPFDGGNERVSRFLLGTLVDVLGDDGVANENTPVYQAFYLKLLNGITEFQGWAYGTAEPDFAELQSLATEAYRRMLLPNRAVPPLGDASYSPQTAYAPLPGLWSSEKNGLLVSSNQDTFFSFISGYRGVFHKQIDDSSVYLWHNGDALIQDAGLVSYDVNNPVAVAVRGQLGHSGVFFKEFDQVRAEKIIAYGPRTRQINASLEMRRAEGAFDFQAVGTYKFRGILVNRTVTWEGPKRFLLRDSVNANGDAKEPVSRFLLDPSASVEVDDNGVLIVRTPRAWMVLAKQSNEVDVKIIRGVRTKAGLSQGFMAPKNYHSVPTTMLEFPIRLEDNQIGKQLFRVSFGNAEEPVKPWTS
ncbi:heparinase II/III domain-containing protein [Corynebacterium minutissimum]